MVILSLAVFPNLEDNAVEVFAHPANGPVLFRSIRTLVEVVWMRKYFLRLFESDSTFGIRSQLSTLSRVEVESHKV